MLDEAGRQAWLANMRAQFVGDGRGGYVLGGGYQVSQTETDGPGQRAPCCSRCQLLQLLPPPFFSRSAPFCSRFQLLLPVPLPISPVDSRYRGHLMRKMPISIYIYIYIYVYTCIYIYMYVFSSISRIKRSQIFNEGGRREGHSWTSSLSENTTF